MLTMSSRCCTGWLGNGHIPSLSASEKEVGNGLKELATFFKFTLALHTTVSSFGLQSGVVGRLFNLPRIRLGTLAVRRTPSQFILSPRLVSEFSPVSVDRGQEVLLDASRRSSNTFRYFSGQ